MKILVSNDDGVNAPGIKVLAKALGNVGDISVVAPDRDRSAASHSLTLESPLRVHALENGFISVNGTPTDCVHLALTSLLDSHPDMVVSGINAGSNLGDDVLYSGTVAAAIEGRFLGYPTIAISLAGNGDLSHYETAGICAQKMVHHLMQHPLKKEIILNVNVPDLPLDDIKGFKVTRLGARHRAESMLKEKDPRGKTIYWVGAVGEGEDAGPGTDFDAVAQGYVSITPLKVDLTDYDQMSAIEEWFGHSNF